MMTANQKSAVLETLKAIADTIKELKSVPNGHLYARVMGHLSLNQYNQIINILVKSKIIKNDNNLLTWIA